MGSHPSGDQLSLGQLSLPSHGSRWQNPRAVAASPTIAHAASYQKRGPSITDGEQFRLLTLIAQIRRFANRQTGQLEQWILVFKPETVRRWQRNWVRKQWTVSNTPKASGRPSTDPQFVLLMLRMARENRWGEDPIEGKLKKLGDRISHETVRKLLRSHGFYPDQQDQHHPIGAPA